MIAPNECPFINPPAKLNGNPVPRQDWNEFINYSLATSMFQAYEAALTKLGVSNLFLQIVDGIATGQEGFTLDTPVNNPPAAGDISTWHIQGYFTLSGMTYILNDWAGDIFYRTIYPNSVDFGPNGWGGTNLLFHLMNYGPTGLAEGYWN
jgi:hypothetical protein